MKFVTRLTMSENTGALPDNPTADGFRRSRRSTGVAAKSKQNEKPARQPHSQKRKAAQVDEDQGRNGSASSSSLDLDFILTDVKSPLTKLAFSVRLRFVHLLSVARLIRHTNPPGTSECDHLESSFSSSTRETQRTPSSDCLPRFRM